MVTVSIQNKSDFHSMKQFFSLKRILVYFLILSVGCTAVVLTYLAMAVKSQKPELWFMVAVVVIFIITFVVIAIYSSYFGRNIILRHDMMVDNEKVKYREMKQQMTNNIAHELRTPVSSIRGYLETLTTCPDIAPERKQAFIERAYIQTIRLSDLIRDIALITKIEEASATLTKEDVCLKTVMDEVLTEFRESLEKNEVISENMLDNLHINGSPTLIYAIFRNLVENSLKYGGSHITIHIECTGMRNGKCEIVYYDTGKGVDEQHLNRIFERFYRISEGRTRDDGGSGLGLSIVRNAIDFHKGEITALVRPSGGLEYRFSLSVR